MAGLRPRALASHLFLSPCPFRAHRCRPWHAVPTVPCCPLITIRPRCCTHHKPAGCPHHKPAGCPHRTKGASPSVATLCPLCRYPRHLVRPLRTRHDVLPHRSTAHLQRAPVRGVRLAAAANGRASSPPPGATGSVRRLQLLCTARRFRWSMNTCEEEHDGGVSARGAGGLGRFKHGRAGGAGARGTVKRALAVSRPPAPAARRHR